MSRREGDATGIVDGGFDHNRRERHNGDARVEAGDTMRVRSGLALAPSPHADAIYLADLFLIDGRAWMIGGAGKGRAAVLASGGDPTAEIARDSVAVQSDDDALYGRFDPGALPRDAAERDACHPRRRFDAIAYCLSEAETAQAYSGRPLAIAPVDNKMLAWTASCQIYPGHLAPLYFEPAQIARLINRNLRVTRFLQLTDGIAGARFLVVPWMATVEAKAALYVGHA
jgi:hypothetical protein